jgi:hypothetical protein
MLISSLYHRAIPKSTVNGRRINKEMKRIKLQAACFVPNPRLIRRDGSVKVAGVK